MLPYPEGVCGPTCGYSRDVLRAKSMWSPDFNRSARAGREGPQRKHLLFYGGLIGDPRRDDFTGRGGLYVLYRNHSDYLVVNTGPPDHERADFSEAMQVRAVALLFAGLLKTLGRCADALLFTEPSRTYDGLSHRTLPHCVLVSSTDSCPPLTRVLHCVLVLCLVEHHALARRLPVCVCGLACVCVAAGGPLHNLMQDKPAKLRMAAWLSHFSSSSSACNSVGALSSCISAFKRRRSLLSRAFSARPCICLRSASGLPQRASRTCATHPVHMQPCFVAPDDATRAFSTTTVRTPLLSLWICSGL